MGTLVTENNKPKASSRNKSLKTDVEDKELQKLQKKIEKEYSKIRYELERLRQSFDAVDNARPYDDINLRLKNLEKVSKKMRKGSIMFKGTKHHSKLLQKLQKRSIG